MTENLHLNTVTAPLSPIERIILRARRMVEVNPELRFGQAVFNVAYELHPGETDRLRAGPFDPFYDGTKVMPFLTALGWLIEGISH